MLELTTELVREEAAAFSINESRHAEKSLYGVTDGTAVGTYLEHKFKASLQNKYEFQVGNSASGIDFPELLVDLTVTSIAQPQSSCPIQLGATKNFWFGVFTARVCL